MTKNWPLPRRNFVERGVRLLVGLASVAGLTKAGDGSIMARQHNQVEGTPEFARGRLVARPQHPAEEAAPGLYSLGLAADRDALLYVPTGYQPHDPAPFVLSLHGAGGNEHSGLYPLHALADAAGLVLLAPASRRETWDILRNGFGPDVAFINASLGEAFARCAVDPERIAVAGFSDGASYALTLGIANGDLFRQVMAFSPGFAAPLEQHGQPRIFISHGTNDEVLAIDPTSRRIVPQLERGGYDVDYLEFEGGHTVPTQIAQAAVDWFLDPSTGTPVPATPLSTVPQPRSGSMQQERDSDPAQTLVLYSLGDSILDCSMYNAEGLDPPQLLVRNNDRLFPEFKGQDLALQGLVRLEHRARDGATVDDLPAQARGILPEARSVALLTIGGNDLLRGLLVDEGPGVEAFAAALDAFLRDLPIRPVLIGNIYDPTFGDDTRNFTGINPVLARENHRLVNAVLTDAAEKYAALIDLHAHFLNGDPSWCAQIIEPSLRGASEVRRCFLPSLQAVLAATT